MGRRIAAFATGAGLLGMSMLPVTGAGAVGSTGPAAHAPIGQVTAGLSVVAKKRYQWGSINKALKPVSGTSSWSQPKTSIAQFVVDGTAVVKLTVPKKCKEIKTWTRTDDISRSSNTPVEGSYAELSVTQEGNQLYSGGAVLYGAIPFNLKNAQGKTLLFNVTTTAPTVIGIDVTGRCR